MSEVKRSLALNVPAAEVWKLIGGFGDIPDWHPAAASCTLHDERGETRRVISLVGGGSITERLVAQDDAAMSCTYAIVESPLPVSEYQSTISVTPSSGGCEVQWSGRFEPAGVPATRAEEVVAGIYDAGLGALATRFA